MAGRGAYAVAARVLRQLRRDRRTLLLILVQPLLIMAVFGYAFGGEVSGAKVAVANLDRGHVAAEVLARLDRGTVDVAFYDTETAVEAAVQRQDARMGVVFPSNFSRNLASGQGGEDGARTAYLVLYKDNTNVQVTAAAQGAFADALARALENVTGRGPAFAFDEHVLFGPADGKGSLEFFVPGIAAFAIFNMGSMLTVVAVVKERTQGTLPRVLAAPVRRWEVVLGLALAFGLFSLLQATVVLGVAALFFGIPIRGSLLLALLTTTLVGVVALGIGILVSGVSRSEFQAVQAVSFLIFPNMLLAGIFAPVESMPWLVRPVSRLVPLSYAVEALRSIVNHGAGLAAVLPDLLVLLAFAAGALGLSALTFGRRAG